MSRQVGTGRWVGSCAGGGLWVISVPDWWPPAVLHPPPPSPACGQVRAAVALDDVTAKAIQAVHAHHQLRPAKRVGRLVRDVEREVPHQQLVVT